MDYSKLSFVSLEKLYYIRFKVNEEFERRKNEFASKIDVGTILRQTGTKHDYEVKGIVIKHDTEMYMRGDDYYENFVLKVIWYRLDKDNKVVWADIRNEELSESFIRRVEITGETAWDCCEYGYYDILKEFVQLVISKMTVDPD